MEHMKESSIAGKSLVACMEDLCGGVCVEASTMTRPEQKLSQRRNLDLLRSRKIYDLVLERKVPRLKFQTFKPLKTEKMIFRTPRRQNKRLLGLNSLLLIYFLA